MNNDHLSKWPRIWSSEAGRYTQIRLYFQICNYFCSDNSTDPLSNQLKPQEFAKCQYLTPFWTSNNCLKLDCVHLLKELIGSVAGISGMHCQKLLEYFDKNYCATNVIVMRQNRLWDVFARDRVRHSSQGPAKGRQFRSFVFLGIQNNNTQARNTASFKVTKMIKVS